MNTKKLSLWQKGLVAVAGLVPFGASQALAQNPASQPEGNVPVAVKPADEYNVFGGARTRLEVTSGENAVGQNYQNIKSTVGLSDNRGCEWFRIYDNQCKTGDVNQHWTSAGVALPPIKLGDWGFSSCLFGSTGDREGLGTQIVANNDRWTITGNLERAEIPTEATRVGIGADYKVNDWLTVGAGFDQVENSSGTTNNYFGKAVVMVTPKDRIGVAFRSSDLEGSVTNTVLGSYAHYGKDEKWGTRTHGMYTWNNDTDFKNFGFCSIVAQNPTLGNLSCGWLEGRARSDMFDTPVVDGSVDVAERCPLNYRSKNGWVFQADGGMTSKPNFESYFVSGTAGYTFEKINLGGISVKPGVLGFVRYDSCNGENKSTVGASGIFDFGKIFGGDACFEITGKTGSDGSSEIYSGLQLKWSW